MSEAFGLDPGDAGDGEEFSWVLSPGSVVAGHNRDNEVPVTVPFMVDLVHTGSVFVGFTGAVVGSAAARLDMIVRVRRAGDVPGHDLVAVEDDLALGVEYPDGRRAVSVPTRWPAVAFGDAVLTRQNAMMFGGGRELLLPWSVAPVPTEGPLTFVLRWPALGIDEARATVDATPLATGRSAVRTLWPWEHEDPHLPQDEPQPPDLPAGSWFGWTLDAG